MTEDAGVRKIGLADSGDCLTLDPAFCQIRKAVRILGNGNRSKVSVLVERILALLNTDAKPADIRVICASSTVCLDLRERLRRQVDPRHSDAADHVEITTTRELAYHVLSTPEAQNVIGRTFCNGKARLLSAFEMDFILADLKTLGNHPERLRELLKFLFRGLTELADEGRGWLVSQEERETLAFLRSELRFLQGVIEPELSNLASKALRACDAIKERYTKAHIFIIDYQNLSRASQLLCHLLATESITVLADSSMYAEVYDSYPYAEGIEEFLRINLRAETQILDKQEPPTVVEIWDWEVPDREFAGVPNRICEQLDNGEDPENIAVVCFHPQWFNKIMCGLRARGLFVRGLYEPLTLKGDVRLLSRSLALRIVTALRLLDEPSDSMACRCWVGFGDRLASNSSFVKSREEAEAENPDVVFADVVAQWEGWKQSAGFIEGCTEKKGKELLEYLAKSLSVTGEAKIPPVLAPLLGLGEDAAPDDMIALLDQKQFFPQFSTTEGITMASLETLAGLGFGRIITVGFVNGLFPHRSYFDLVEATVNNQKNIEERENRRLALLVSAASDELVLSYFKRVEQKNAEQLQLKSDRNLLDENLMHICMVSLSVLANELL